MSKSKMNIPQKINVGYQNRQDTYTGKLAYVTYTDQKGVLRKETSWSGWRDHKIEPHEFENVPTEGFVLNKKVGDHRYGWNPRKAWVRIYDPRGFEFEISVANLIFILEECSSIKGKGLEGEFVYAWDRADLVLLPVTSQEYQQCTEFTALQTKKITKADMTEGCVYVNKQNEKVLYLGRHDFYTWDYDWYRAGPTRHVSKKKRLHVFVRYNEGEETEYWTQTGYAKLAAKLSDEVSSDFASEYDKFKKSVHGSPPDKFEFKKVKNAAGRVAGSRWFKCATFAIKHGGDWHVAEVCKRDHPTKEKKKKFEISTSSVPIEFAKPEDGQTFYRWPNITYHDRNTYRILPKYVDAEELSKYEFCDMYVVTEKGHRTQIGY